MQIDNCFQNRTRLDISCGPGRRQEDSDSVRNITPTLRTEGKQYEHVPEVRGRVTQEAEFLVTSLTSSRPSVQGSVRKRSSSEIIIVTTPQQGSDVNFHSFVTKQLVKS